MRDIGGPVEGSDGTMAYRLTGVARQSDTFIGLGTKDDRAYIAPAFTWKPSADTTLPPPQGMYAHPYSRAPTDGHPPPLAPTMPDPVRQSFPLHYMEKV